MSYPLNDEYMIYDLDEQRYKLTIDGVNNILGINIVELAGSEREADIILDEASQDVYDYISYYSLYNSYKFKVWLIAKDSELREKFKRVLANQIRYYIKSGAGSLKDMHGVHIEKQKALSLNQLRGDVSVSFAVERQLNAMGLLYTGRLYYTEYSEDGTW